MVDVVRDKLILTISFSDFKFDELETKLKEQEQNPEVTLLRQKVKLSSILTLVPVNVYFHSKRARFISSNVFSSLTMSNEPEAAGH